MPIFLRLACISFLAKNILLLTVPRGRSSFSAISVYLNPLKYIINGPVKSSLISSIAFLIYSRRNTLSDPFLSIVAVLLIR